LLSSIARRVGLNDADAADAAQATWIRLMRALPGLRNPECLPGWLAQTGRRESLRVAMATSRATPMADPEDVRQQLPAPGADTPLLDRYIGDERIATALEKLAPSYRSLLALLTCDADLSYSEIAERLGIAPGSIGPMRQRLLRALRSQLSASGHPAFSHNSWLPAKS
jgi:RNA polymerase sigma factor (sigma-70 family)